MSKTNLSYLSLFFLFVLPELQAFSYVTYISGFGFVGKRVVWMSITTFTVFEGRFSWRLEDYFLPLGVRHPSVLSVGPTAQVQDPRPATVHPVSSENPSSPNPKVQLVLVVYSFTWTLFSDRNVDSRGFLFVWGPSCATLLLLILFDVFSGFFGLAGSRG